MSKTEVFAHRGASGYAPENTLEAFLLAIEQGADGIELDVQLSKDGVPVVIHDETRIPTLREVLDAVRPSGIAVNIELKTGIYWYPEIEKKVAAIVEETGMKDRVIYSSFNHYSVQKLKSIVPDAETAYLFSDVILRVDDYAAKSGVDGLHPAVYHVKMAEFLSEYLASGLKTRVWTVNERADMKMLIDAGVTAVITNYPDIAIAVRDR